MKRKVQVTQIIEVEIDEAKFTPEFMAEFSGFMFEADLNDHFEYIAQAYARGIYDEFSDFLEGYGPPKDMGIKVKQVGQEEEILDERAMAA